MGNTQTFEETQERFFFQSFDLFLPKNWIKINLGCRINEKIWQKIAGEQKITPRLT